MQMTLYDRQSVVQRVSGNTSLRYAPPLLSLYTTDRSTLAITGDKGVNAVNAAGFTGRKILSRLYIQAVGHSLK